MNAENGSLEFQDLNFFADSSKLSLLECCDILALHVAREYANGQLTYQRGDRIINSLFAVATLPDVWSVTKNEVSPILFAVYQAFDEGEYLHPCDDADLNPEVRYTQPLIALVLERYNAG